MEQNFGPHIEQKCAVLAGSCGSVASWNRRAVTGSSDRLNWSYLRARRGAYQAVLRTWSRRHARGAGPAAPEGRLGMQGSPSVTTPWPARGGLLQRRPGVCCGGGCRAARAHQRNSKRARDSASSQSCAPGWLCRPQPRLSRLRPPGRRRRPRPRQSRRRGSAGWSYSQEAAGHTQERPRCFDAHRAAARRCLALLHSTANKSHLTSASLPCFLPCSDLGAYPKPIPHMHQDMM